MLAYFYSLQVGDILEPEVKVQDFIGLNFFSIQPQTMTESLHLKEIVIICSAICLWCSVPFQPLSLTPLYSPTPVLCSVSGFWAEANGTLICFLKNRVYKVNSGVSYRQTSYGSPRTGEGPGVKMLKHCWPNIRPGFQNHHHMPVSDWRYMAMDWK